MTTTNNTQQVAVNDIGTAEDFLAAVDATIKSVSYTHLTLTTTLHECRSRWSPYH